MNTYNTTVEGCRLYSQARSMAYHMEHSLLWISTIWRLVVTFIMFVYTLKFIFIPAFAFRSAGIFKISFSPHFYPYTSTPFYNINGSYKYFPSNRNNRSSHTQCTYGYSKFEILRKFFSPILHFPVSRTKRSRAKSCCENSSSTSGTVPYIVTPRVIQ